MKLDKGDIRNFLFGFMVGVGLTLILSLIVFHLIGNVGNDEEKKLDDHRNISGVLRLLYVKYNFI